MTAFNPRLPRFRCFPDKLYGQKKDGVNRPYILFYG